MPLLLAAIFLVLGVSFAAAAAIGRPPTVEAVQPLITSDQEHMMLASVIGAVLQLLYWGQKLTLRGALMCMGGALGVSYLFGTFLSAFLPTNPGLVSATGGLVGICSFSGLSGVFYLLTMWRTQPDEILARFIPRWWGKKGGPE